jgi:dUTP pyrophosphatase
MQKVQVAIINKSRHPLPSYKTLESAGMDLYALLNEPITISSLERTLIPTGIFIAMPIGAEAQIRPRSGIALHQGITVLNSPGTIDSDYRGEIKILVINLSTELQTIQDGDRIAQMIFAKHEKTEWNLVDTLPISIRGEGGYGSTGVANKIDAYFTKK